eukprot:1155008-Pelagomonas_calceolata.AAC.7
MQEFKQTLPAPAQQELTRIFEHAMATNPRSSGHPPSPSPNHHHYQTPAEEVPETESSDDSEEEGPSQQQQLREQEAKRLHQEAKVGAVCRSCGAFCFVPPSEKKKEGKDGKDGKKEKKKEGKVKEGKKGERILVARPAQRLQLFVMPIGQEMASEAIKLRVRTVTEMTGLAFWVGEVTLLQGQLGENTEAFHNIAIAGHQQQPFCCILNLPASSLQPGSATAWPDRIG